MADRRTDGTLSDDQSSATLANDASVPNNDVASSAHSHASDDDAAGPGEDAPGVERCAWARITPSRFRNTGLTWMSTLAIRRVPDSGMLSYLSGSMRQSAESFTPTKQPRKLGIGWRN